MPGSTDSRDAASRDEAVDVKEEESPRDEPIVNEDGTTDEDLLKSRGITAGWYATEDGSTTSVAHWLEEDDFRKNGGVMNHETVESMGKRNKPFTVDYTGFGWVMIKHGVFEHNQRH